MVLIKYNAGNIQSVSFALERLGVDFTISDDPETISKAEKVIFPGVGEASSTMAYLRERKLDQVITNLKQPVLGICLGMQLMCRHSEENDTPCLGIFDQPVKRFIPETDFKVPHMGWNSLTKVNDWIQPELENKSVYYVHSYYVPVNNFTSAVTPYTVPFSAAMRKDNFYAVQFHPEKSAEAGQMILKNFLAI
ncbi:MAG TPA: imidazole glycerol phosphate synthase subunit HisH [Cyclobacteriaceae bacterium]|nr:imidazole glycerol phosphate synthase subunit HisH [Cyclobacteriaceae bacterium]HMV09935.1 imidazole glycerol phosphate synthase subunit HisH [Cyclobacteriaceae bacterium]HMV90690.1 imidazole glycerol phosphate synthase subunit HisH [Cyclobacteriaceae bacterium]HMX01626.1 imidazole glycerol phosphate synthase subunit HisH [Cyclobacteriaceae bacterium]HMX50680.1 imidazole glycerol phosphate synthase subunit HisH [Cyclobacteriaceae bacterium]